MIIPISCPLEKEEKESILESFFEKIAEQKDIDPKFAEVINENFWDLI